MRRFAGLLSVVAVIATVLVVAVAAPSAAITCDKTWADPGTDGVWEDPNVTDFLETQWSPAGPPTIGDSVCLPGGGYVVHVLGPAIADDLQIGDELGGQQPTLLVRGLGAGQALTLAITGTAENFGTLRLGNTAVSTDVAVTVGETFTNHELIDLIQGGGGTRTLHGAGVGSIVSDGVLRSSSDQGLLSCIILTSTGTIDVDPTKQLGSNTSCGGVGVTLSGGSVVNDGSFVVASSLAVNGTAITGTNPVSLVLGQLSFSGSPTGKVRVGEASIAGTIPAGIELSLDDFDPGSTAFLNLSGPLTNAGTIRLTGADLGATYIDAGTNTFTNNGTVLYEQAAGGGRGLRSDPPGKVVNNGLIRSSSSEGDYCGTVRNQAGGTLDIDPGARFWPHGFCSTDGLELVGGTVRNEGEMRANDMLTIGGNVDLTGGGVSNPLFQSGGTLTFQAGSTAEGDVMIPFDNTLAAGTVPEDITLTVLASGFVDTVLTATGAVTNEGTLRLTSDGDPFASTLRLAGTTFTNNGTIELLAGTGGQRRLQGNPSGTLQNNGLLHVATPNGRNGCAATVNSAAGTIDVDAGATWTTNCGSHALTVSGGTVDVDGTLGATTATVNNGTVSVDGTLSATTATVNGGSLSVDGSLQTTTTAIAGGRVTGNGAIAGSVTNSGGMVAPGASVGVLDVSGSYTQSAGGRLEIEIEPGVGSPAIDRLDVTGNATLAGSVLIDAGAVVAAMTPIVDATGTVTGTFAGVRGVPDPWVHYHADSAMVESVVTFPDVPLSHPFFLDIAWAAGEGMVTGFGDGTFRPGGTATRQAVVATLYRLAGSPDGPDPACASAPFFDVPTSHVFCGEIEWATDEGVVNGFSDGTFRPADIITRQALMATLYRMAGSPDGDDPTCSSAPFTDVPLAHPFCGEIEWAKGEGLATGFSDGTFGPAATLSRQTIAAFLHRFTVAGLLGSF